VLAVLAVLKVLAVAFALDRTDAMDPLVAGLDNACNTELEACLLIPNSPRLTSGVPDVAGAVIDVDGARHFVQIVEVDVLRIVDSIVVTC